MIEMLLAKHSAEVNPNLRYTFNGEVPGPAFSDVRTAAGFTTGTLRNGSTWLSYTEKATGENWLISKTPIVYNVSMTAMENLNVFEGKNIVVNDTNYYCKSIRMTIDGTFTASDISNGATIASYGAGSVFANSDFNHIFYPIFGLPGTSIEGITFGSSAQYPISELGFADPQNAQIGAERNATSYHIVINSANPTQTRLSRAGSNAAWGWRPMIRNDGDVSWNVLDLDFSNIPVGSTQFSDKTGINFERPIGTALVINDSQTGTNVAQFNGDGGFEASFSSRTFVGKNYVRIEVIFIPDTPPTTSSDYQCIFETGAVKSPYTPGYQHTFNNTRYETWSQPTTSPPSSSASYSTTISNGLNTGVWQKHIIEHNIGTNIIVTRYDLDGNLLGSTTTNYNRAFQGDSPTISVGHSWVGARSLFLKGRLRSIKILAK